MRVVLIDHLPLGCQVLEMHTYWRGTVRHRRDVIPLRRVRHRDPQHGLIACQPIEWPPQIIPSQRHHGPCPRPVSLRAGRVRQGRVEYLATGGTPQLLDRAGRSRRGVSPPRAVRGTTARAHRPGSAPPRLTPPDGKPPALPPCMPRRSVVHGHAGRPQSPSLAEVAFPPHSQWPHLRPQAQGAGARPGAVCVMLQRPACGAA
jgi:hypothetical protein